MTVKQMIDILERMDPDTRLFTVGYEGGYEDVTIKGAPFDVALNVNEEWYYGPHESANKIDDKSKYEIVKGIIL